MWGKFDLLWSRVVVAFIVIPGAVEAPAPVGIAASSSAATKWSPISSAS